MLISTRVYVEHPDIPLSHTIRTCQDAEIGVVSDAATDPERDLYVFWIEAEDFADVERTLADDPTVEEFTPIVEDDDRRTYQIAYSDDVTLVSPVVTEMGGLIVDTESHANGWRIHLKLRDHDSLYRLHRFADEHDIQLDVLDVKQTQKTDIQSDFGLTDAQVEALTCAYLHGFYDEPREISLDGLASILGISQTAVSGRLRRGATSLIEDVLIDGDGGRE